MEGEQHEFLKKRFQIPSLQKFKRGDVIMKPVPGNARGKSYEYPILITGTDEEEVAWFGYHLAGGKVLRGAYFPWDLAAAEKIGFIELTDYIFESIDKRDKDAWRLLNSIFNYVRDSHEHEKEE